MNFFLLLRKPWLVAGLFSFVAAGAQNPVKTFGDLPSLKYAGWSLVVADAASGKPLVVHQPDLGLPAASTQKIFTSIAALESLGGNFRFNTRLGYSGSLVNGQLNGDLVVEGNGDPSFGSSRFPQTTAEHVLQAFAKAVVDAGIWQVSGRVRIDCKKFEDDLPDGWIWQDMGNYYGAAATALNWRENQFDIVLQSGKTTGSAVSIVTTLPEIPALQLTSEVTAAPAGTGDNAFVYLSPKTSVAVIKGTIPVNEKAFTISGALPEPALLFQQELGTILHAGGAATATSSVNPLFTWQSPSLDTLNYWFLRKSINLYGESLLKTMAIKAGATGNTSGGVVTLKKFWQQRGIDSNALQVIDGSGLSPQNRVTARALTQALYYASRQSWYGSFYQALPVYNGMKLKSGSIGGSRAFAGYHTAANGKKYIIAVIVTNYTGSSREIVQQIFRLLDHWK